MAVIADAIANARYRELERKWQRDDPRAYERLCQLRAIYPYPEWLTPKELARCYFMRWYWRNGDEQ